MERLVIGYQKLQQTIVETPVKKVFTPTFTLRMLMTFVMANSGCNHNTMTNNHHTLHITTTDFTPKKK